MTILELIASMMGSGAVGYFAGYYDGRHDDTQSRSVVKVVLGVSVILATVAITLRMAG